MLHNADGISRIRCKKKKKRERERETGERAKRRGGAFM